MYTVRYNGCKCTDVGLKVAKRPNIPIPQKRIIEIIIPGKSGALHVDEGTYEGIEILVEFNFSQPPNEWGVALRKIRKWLHGKGDGRLIFSDDEQFFYKVSYVRADDDIERKLKRLGYLEAVFVCEPFTYSIEGDTVISIPCVLQNDGEVADPLYQISGEGVCTLTVNGNSVTANVGQELIIDTELLIAFRGEAIENTAVTGDLEALRLQAGENSIEITEGFTATVVPRWRYL